MLFRADSKPSDGQLQQAIDDTALIVSNLDAVIAGQAGAYDVNDFANGVQSASQLRFIVSGFLNTLQHNPPKPLLAKLEQALQTFLVDPNGLASFFKPTDINGTRDLVSTQLQNVHDDIDIIVNP